MDAPQNFFGYGDGATSVGMKVKDPFPADTTASGLAWSYQTPRCLLLTEKVRISSS